MIKNGMYYVTEDYKNLVRSLGGEWNDKKERPMACVLQLEEFPDIFWAIPVGKVNHRNNNALERINGYMDKKDIRGSYYHIGRTTNKSIFFISDVVPITDKYISMEHNDINGNHFIIKNKSLLKILDKKLRRILTWENANNNYFRQHITDIKNYLITENKRDQMNH